MNEQEETIDLRVLLKVLIEHIVPIIIAIVLAAGIGFSLAKFIVPKKYTSEALMYVENSASKQEDTAININDITAAQKLVNTCQILFTSDYVFGELSDHFGGVFTIEQLQKMIRIESVNNTEVLRISVETWNPEDSYNIANELIRLSIEEFARIIKNGSMETVSAPTLPDKHSFPNAVLFTAVGALIGAVVSYAFFLTKEMLDTKLKPDDDLVQIYDLPVFAEILDFDAAGKAENKYARYDTSDSYGYESREETGERKKNKENREDDEPGKDDPKK